MKENDFKTSEDYGNWLRANPLELEKRKAEVSSQNQGLVPEQSDEKCETCGSHLSHPDTAFCFICDTDNWEMIRY